MLSSQVLFAQLGMVGCSCVNVLTSLTASIRAQRLVYPDSGARLRIAAWNAVKSAFRLFSGRSRELRRKRLAECERCALFSPLKTCGHVELVTGDPSLDIAKGATWHHPVTGEYELLGCGCYLPLKALEPDATCYLRDTGADEGWPDNLNGNNP